jgi:hypothetical protein
LVQDITSSEILTKARYVTFIKPKLVNEVANSQPVSYSSIRKRLERKKIKLRFNELRDYFGTYLLNHGILEAEINLCQGRIPVDIFIRHYWSPKLQELGNRTPKTLEATDKAKSVFPLTHIQNHYSTARKSFISSLIKCIAATTLG